MWSTFPIFGSTLLLAVMVVASYTFAISLSAGATGRIKTLQAARLGAYGTVALIAVAVLCLAYAFVSHDFRLRYVAHYSDRSMPTIFLLTALWGGQDGSLLWWLFLLAGYIGACVFGLGKKHVDLQPYILATLMAIVVFFCVLMAFAANPFSTSIAGARTDGEGLNPLLQNFYMIIHPPSLYVGFVGCSIPFAFAVAALATGRLDAEWIQACRKFTLFALLFLAIGNTLGMLWAYEELGWGGYWAWDPVENAAFMPLLSLAAFVHSVMIQERRGMLKVWNVFLICLTFFMTIFGTFLTRSGAIASVHSFAQSSIGEYFLWFLGFLAAFTSTLIMYRWPELRGVEPAVSSKERLEGARGRASLGVSILIGLGVGGLLEMIAMYGWHREIAAAGMTSVTWAISGLAAGAAFFVVRRPIAQWTASPINTFRAAAIVAGWVVVAGLGPGAWVLSGKIGTMAATARVAIFSVVVGIAVFASVELVYRRMTAGLKLTPNRPRMESLLSREFTFLLNNYGLLGIMLFVLVATTFPMVSEALWNEKVTVGPPYYNAWMQPLGLTVFFLMGVGTLFGWKKTSPDALRRAFVAPTTAGLLAVILHFVAGKQIGFPAVVWSEPIYGGPIGAMLRAFNAFTPVLGFSLAVFNIAVITQEFVLLYRAQTRAESSRSFLTKVPAGARPFAAIGLFPAWALSLPPTGRRRYGGYVVHLGIALMFLGFTGKSWTVDRETSMTPGQTYAVEHLTVKYVGPRMEVDNNKRMIFADVKVFENGKEIGKLTPAKFIYKKMPESPTTEVSMLHSIRDDLYLVVGSINPDTKVATLQIHLNPLVGWIWFGAIILIFGSFVCMWPELDPAESRVWRVARGTAAVAASTTLGIVLALMPVPAFAQATASQHAGSVQIDNPIERRIFSALRCMCGTCPRELLSSCVCSEADQMRERLRARLAKGESADHIIDDYIAEFGSAALAFPPDKGGLKAIYAAPLLAIAGGGLGLAVMLRRWRANETKARKSSEPSEEAKRDDYDDRIDKDLKDLDD